MYFISKAHVNLDTKFSSEISDLDLNFIKFKVEEVQLTLEPHGFKLHGSTYTRIFFSPINISGPCYLQVLHLQNQPTASCSSVPHCILIYLHFKCKISFIFIYLFLNHIYF